MDPFPSLDALESVHEFPGRYRIKVIGVATNEFAGRVLAVVSEELAAPDDLEHSIRSTREGRHVALTLDLTVQSAAQVRAIYERIHAVEGLTLLL